MKTINSLPFELLIDILVLTLPEPVSEDAIYPSQYTLDTIRSRNFLKVCRRWRHLVQTTQELWTHWAIRLDRAYDSHIRMATCLLQQVLELSGDRPISFYLHFSYPDHAVSYETRTEFKETVSLSQRRWGRARMNIVTTISSKYEWDIPVDVTRLAISSLRELRVNYPFGRSRPIGGRTQLLQLSTLVLESCNRSLHSLLSLAPNLESLTLFRCDIMTQVYFHQLKTLQLDGSKRLQNITCPTLQHLYSSHNSCAGILPFVERNKLQLLTLKIGSNSANDIILLLRSLPSLITLDMNTFDFKDVCNEMAKVDHETGQFLLCPRLQHITLGDEEEDRNSSYGKADLEPGECAALMRFIESRWNTPVRTIKIINIRYRGINLNRNPWDPMRRFVEEGLDLHRRSKRKIALVRNFHFTVFVRC